MNHIDPLAKPDFNNTLTLQDMVFQVWKRRYLVAGLTLLGAIAGVVIALTSKPIYVASSLMQLDIKTDNQSAPSEFTQMQKYLSSEISSDGEIGLLRSRNVMGEVVDRMNLDLQVGAEGTFFKRLLRRPVPEIDLEVLRMPAQYLETPFDLVAVDSLGKYELRDSLGTVLLSASTGETVDSSSNTLGFTLRVRSIRNAAPGQVFKLMKSGSQEAIENLNKVLSISEEGKKTGLMALSLEGTDPHLTARILDTIMRVYQEAGALQNAAAAERRAQFLEAQLPGLKKAMDSAESALHGYRKLTGALDIGHETNIAMEQLQRLQQQVQDFEQKRKEASERFRPGHPAIVTIDSALGLLKIQISRQMGSMRSLPVQQQEILRLNREADVAEEMYTSVVKEAHNYRVVAEQAVPSAKIIDPAIPSLRPQKPKKKNLVVGAVFGAFLFGCGLAVALRILLGGIEDPQLIEDILEKPVMTLIPRVREQRQLESRIADGKKGIHILAHSIQEHVALECIRILRIPLMNAIAKGANKIVTITGVSPDDGKSFVSANLAILLAQTGLKVALVDADLRRGHLHKSFGLYRGRGLSNVLAGEFTMQEAMSAVDVPGLSFLAAGQVSGRTNDLMNSPRMIPLMQELSDRYDVVIMDVAPLLAVTDADTIGQFAGTSLMVLRHGAHTTGDLITCRRRIQQSEINVVGVVINDVDLMAPIYGTRFGRRLHRYQTKSI
ncbi:MAG: polysaccharide biosynthesis tyrosine autokinase [Fibrobacteria bacterium]|nr:polysaccharide biosynthesis tyrosine autokinase [Fibrobacteria bacterium]